MAGRIFIVMMGGALLTLLSVGCTPSMTRPPQTPERLLQMRAEADQQEIGASRALVAKMMQRTKAQYDDYTNHKRPDQPVVDILIISGGGDWGAFGSGFLKGWKKIPAGDPMAMPDFAAVTGVSTGALIAPFAFLGDNESIDRVVNLYRNPKPDWVKTRGFLYFLPSNISFAEVPGLERELRANVSSEMIKRIADKENEGRILAVNTTNVDDGEPRVFDLCAEARHAVESGDYDRFRNIMLASAGIPGAFPFRIIDNELYVDGGITGNIIYGGRLGEEDTFPALWQKTYPDLRIPKTRFWVIFNNQVRPPPQVTPPRWPPVVQRALEMATRSATLTAMRHLLATAEISQLKRHADVEVRIVAIPNEWSPPVPGIFVKETMNNLADMGERMGADPSSWMQQVPP